MSGLGIDEAITMIYGNDPMKWYSLSALYSLFFNSSFSFGIFVFFYPDWYLTIIRLRLSEYCRIIPETKSRGLFDNIHWAWGE